MGSKEKKKSKSKSRKSKSKKPVSAKDGSIRVSQKELRQFVKSNPKFAKLVDSYRKKRKKTDDDDDDDKDDNPCDIS